jgi:NAD(P)-dependent dehydrogenase (short-subunit alcohol dehydrogenase family)
MQSDFTGKRVLVTGGTRGIGRATVQAFLEAGAAVAVNGRTAESTAAAIAGLDAADARLCPAPGDVATAAGCDAVVAAALARLGGLDILVNSAGVLHRGPMAGTDEALWDRLIDINVKGTYFCSRAALPAVTASQGAIVNLASEAGLAGYGELTAYCASKGAIVNLTRAMAMELAPKVRVNCVCPGVIDTDMVRDGCADPEAAAAKLAGMAEDYPLKRIGSAEEVAAAILYLASPAARFITGTALVLDGGATAGS